MHYILSIHRIEITLAKAEIVDGIEQVGFADTVLTHKAIDTGRQGQFSLTDIFKVHY
jgi:hypothetical protein